MSFIIIPIEEAHNFKRTISRFESIEPVELSDCTFMLPADILDRLDQLAASPDYQVNKAEYVSTLKAMLEVFDQKSLNDIKDLIIQPDLNI